MKVKIDPGAYIPTRAHQTDAGLDIRAKEAVQIPPKCWANIPTGVHIQLPSGMAGMLISSPE